MADLGLVPPSLLARALMLGYKARVAADTYRRYVDLSGGGDDPRGELWDAIAGMAELVEELTGLVWEQECAQEDRRG